MKILILDLGAGWRGGQAQTALVSSSLARRGHDVALIARRGSPLAERARKAGVRVVEAPRGFEGAPGLLAAVRRAARRFRPEVLWACDAKGHGAAVWSLVASRVPLVVHRRVSFPPGRGLLSRLKYRRANRFIAVSRGVAASLRDAGIPAAKIVVVPDGLPSSAFVSRDAPSPPPWRLAHVGAFDGLKGQEVAVAVLARLVARGLDATLTFLGDGPEREGVRRIATGLAVASRCAFVGEVRDVSERLAGAHALILPSHAEGLSMAVMEAMAAGCAVVVRDLPGPRELTAGGAAGILVPSLDSSDWAEAAASLLLDAARRAHLVNAGRAAAAEWTIDRTVSHIEAALREAV